MAAFDWTSLLPIIEDILGLLKGTGALSTTGNNTVDQHLGTVAGLAEAANTPVTPPVPVSTTAPPTPAAPTTTSTSGPVG